MRWMWGLVVVAGVGALFTGLALDGSSQTNEEWFGHSAAVALLALLTMGLAAIGVKLSGLVVGEDGRTSTSKVQALAWTYALAAALLSLMISKCVGAGDGYAALLKEGVKDEYLLLLGGPFAAAIAAKGIVTAKIDGGTIAKTPGTPSVAQVFSGDDDRADLVDTQYLLFNFVALVCFVGLFVTEADGGLPNLPEVLVALTSVAAAAYVSNKAIAKDAPALLSIVPAQAVAGTQVMVHGKSLRVIETKADGSTEQHEPQVSFGEQAVVGTGTTIAGYDQIAVTVPEIAGLAAPLPIKVKVTNAIGSASNELPFTVLPPSS